MYKLDELTKQHTAERMAREADKILGISTALTLALTECRADAQEVAGAFEAMTDIARNLAEDLNRIAEGEG